MCRYRLIPHDPDTARYRTRATQLRYRTAPVPHHYGMVSQGQSCAYIYRTIPHDTDTARYRYRTMPIPHDATLEGGRGCYGIWDLGFEGLKFLGFGI